VSSVVVVVVYGNITVLSADWLCPLKLDIVKMVASALLYVTFQLSLWIPDSHDGPHSPSELTPFLDQVHDAAHVAYGLTVSKCHLSFKLWDFPHNRSCSFQLSVISIILNIIWRCTRKCPQRTIWRWNRLNVSTLVILILYPYWLLLFVHGITHL